MRLASIRSAGVAAMSLALFGHPATSSAAQGFFHLDLLAEHRSDIEPVLRAAERALPRLAIGTTLADHWAINSTDASASDVRLVLFRSDDTTNQDEVTRTYKDGCQTEVPYKLIICDVRIFDELMSRWGFDRKTEYKGDWPTDKDMPVRELTTQEKADTLLELVTWVLGHEIGHLSVKSSERTADVESLLSEVPGRRLTQTVEVLADQHVFHGSGLDAAGRADLSGFLVGALNAELHRKYCPTRDIVQLCSKIPAGVGVIFDYTKPSGLDIDASKSHPEFLLRLIRLLELSRSPEECQLDGLCIELKEVLERVQATHR